jgi:acyl carrier protein
MKDFTSVCTRLQEIFREELQIDLPAVDGELIEAGLLDSMMFVSLLIHLEEEFGVKIAIQDVEIEEFSTIVNIAKLVVTTFEQKAA